MYKFNIYLFSFMIWRKINFCLGLTKFGKWLFFLKVFYSTPKTNVLLKVKLRDIKKITLANKF